MAPYQRLHLMEREGFSRMLAAGSSLRATAQALRRAPSTLSRERARQPTSNVAWGDDGSTLFVTGGTSVYRIKLTTRGQDIDSPDSKQWQEAVPFPSIHFGSRSRSCFFRESAQR
ncbi:MAG: helix-turn-helix domain-containing protein [Nitrospirae bacterium]|nr:helix-turn-helix domain-containing protein [Nitrospirota bacterium]